MIKKVVIVIGLVVVVFIALAFKQSRRTVDVVEINSFEECAAAGYPIMESYPEQCRTTDGRTFVRNIDRDASRGD
jgi:hypothetical protein